MKNLSSLLTFIILIIIFISCDSQTHQKQSDSKKVIDLPNSVSVEIPTTFIQKILEGYSYVDTISGSSLSFAMTEFGSSGELLPEINMDFLNSQPLTDITEIIINKEIRKISRLEVGIIEKTTNIYEVKTFFTKINNEILICELAGYSNNAEYLDTTFDDILNSIKAK